MQVLKTVKDIRGCSYYGKGSSSWYGKEMEDGKIFSPTIHKRYLQSKYLNSVKRGWLFPVSPTRFTWEIRRWLGAEVSNIIAMKREGILDEDRKMKTYLLGKSLCKYLFDSTRLQESLFYGRDIGHRSGKEWVYLVPEEWIVENFYDLCNSYYAMGCYYTITSLYAYGVLSGDLEAKDSKGNSTTLCLSKDSSSDEDLFELANTLKNDKVFRESLSHSCIDKISPYILGYGNVTFDTRLKDEDGALEKYRKFYSEHFNTRKVTKELYKKYNIPTFSDEKYFNRTLIRGFYI